MIDRGVRLNEVAELAQVSTQTVSNAINAPHRLAPETLERTLAAIEELAYKPNRAARALRNQSSRLIGVKVEASRGDRAALLLDQFLHSLAESAAAIGYHLILCHADDDTAEIQAYRELLHTTAVDAFILASTHRGDPRTPWLRERNVAFATFGRSWDHPDQGDLSWVDVDGRAGIGDATRHLAAQGHRRVAFIGWPPDSDVGRDRRKGWVDACRELGLSTDGLSASSIDDFDGGRVAALDLLALPDPPTALVCVSDTLALGAMRALNEVEKVPGRDVAVSGFDNSPAAALTTPGLTSLRQPLGQVARHLVGQVDAMLHGGDTIPRHSLLVPELVVRESTSPR